MDVTPRYGFPLDDPSGIADARTFNLAMMTIDESLWNLDKKTGVSSDDGVEIYIDPVNGEDGPERGSVGRPFKTWEGMIDSGVLPKVIRNMTWIKILPGTIKWVDLRYIRCESGLLIVSAANGMQLAQGLTGPNTGTATGGTITSLTKAGAGWAVNELRGKAYEIVDGTHSGYSGRVVSNTATSFVLTGYLPSAIDATDVFEIKESTVRVEEPTSVYSSPSPLFLANCTGGIMIWSLDFYGNANKYQSYTALVSGGSGTFLYNCAFYSPKMVAGAFVRDALWVEELTDLDAYNCAFIADESITGYEAGMQINGSCGVIQFTNCVINDQIFSYRGVSSLIFNNCTKEQRVNGLINDSFRTVGYLQFISCVLDYKGLKAGIQLEGGTMMDMRYSKIRNALGDGIYNFGHQGDNFTVYVRDTEINGCSGSGINLGGNSALTIMNLTTDPLAKNTQWGVKIKSGTICQYTGVNTAEGLLGKVNLGDGVTNVAHGVPATDTTHLTRICPLGG